LGNVFKEAKQTLEAKKKAERRERLDENRVADWDDPDDVRSYHRERYRNNRRLALDDAVPDRRCPLCGETRPRSRQWVILDRSLIQRELNVEHHSQECILLLTALLDLRLECPAICRTCYMHKCSEVRGRVALSNK